LKKKKRIKFSFRNTKVMLKCLNYSDVGAKLFNSFHSLKKKKVRGFYSNSEKKLTLPNAHPFPPVFKKEMMKKEI
jgi:hypothetical protein